MLRITDRQPGEWTYEDLQRLPRDGNRYEIIEGYLYVWGSPSWRHQETVGLLGTVLLTHTRRQQLGKTLLAPLDVVFSERSVVQPDLVFVQRERLSILRRIVEGSPDLAIEVVSASKPAYDRVTKFNLYATWKVPCYWILDPLKRTFEAFRLQGDSYVAEFTGSNDEVFQPSLFPGLQFHLEEIWPDEEGTTPES